MKIEAKPKTKLRTACLSALVEKGFCGPNYNLDDIYQHSLPNMTTSYPFLFGI